MTTGRLSQVALMQELEVTEFCAMAKINRYIKMGEGAEGKERGGEEAPSSAGHLLRTTHCGFARPDRPKARDV